MNSVIPFEKSSIFKVTTVIPASYSSLKQTPENRGRTQPPKSWIPFHCPKLVT